MKTEAEALDTQEGHELLENLFDSIHDTKERKESGALLDVTMHQETAQKRMHVDFPCSLPD